MIKHYTYINYSLLKNTKSGVIVSAGKPTNATYFVGLLKYNTGSYTYIILPQNVWIGGLILVTNTFNINLTKICFIELGLKLYKSVITYLKNLQPSSLIFNLCLKTTGQYAKAAGTFCKIITIDLDKELILVQLPTTKKKWIYWWSIAVTGRVSNIFHKKEIFGKAGYYRLANKRPAVRGVAMNPVDHPHGGRTKSNSPEVTPWGKIAKHNK